MSKYREVFDVLQSTEYAEASESLAALLAGSPTARDSVSSASTASVRSFLEEVGLDGWATEDRYSNGYYTFAG